MSIQEKLLLHLYIILHGTLQALNLLSLFKVKSKHHHIYNYKLRNNCEIIPYKNLLYNDDPNIISHNIRTVNKINEFK